MWFKNLRMFALNSDFTAPTDEQLKAFQFEPCKSIETHRLGWSPVVKGGESLMLEQSGSMLFCLRRQEKLLPAAVINELLEERIDAITDRVVGRKERLTMKEDIISELTPRAFVHSTYTWGYVDTVQKLVFIDAPSDKKADEFLDLLRQTLGSLPVVPLCTESSPHVMMTRALQDHNSLPGAVELGSDAELRSDLEEGSVIRVKQTEIDAEEVLAHIETGKQVVKLAVNWKGQVSFKLREDLTVAQLKFGDDLIAEARDSCADDDLATRLDADFALMQLTLRRVVPELVDWLGGRAKVGDA